LEAHHEQYADKDGHNRNGVTRFYNVKGLLDSTATFKDGKMDGDAYKLTTDSFRTKMKYVYCDDTLVSVIDPAVRPGRHEKRKRRPPRLYHINYKDV